MELDRRRRLGGGDRRGAARRACATLREDGLAEGAVRPHEHRGGREVASRPDWRRSSPHALSKGGLDEPRLRSRPPSDGRRSTPPTSHLAAGFPPAVRVRGQDRPRWTATTPLTPAGHARDRLLDPQRRPAQAVRERPAARLRLRDPRRRPLPRQLLLPARLDLGRLPPHPSRDPGPRLARPAGGARGVHPQAARLRPRHRPDRLRQVDDARLDGRRDQREREEHILTIEDPIEFLHRHKSCIVNQREVGADAIDFASALSRALREDPDVILVGEMRDLETISTALTAAETGHLVFATLHTSRRAADGRPHHRRLPAAPAAAGADAARRSRSRASSPSSCCRPPTARRGRRLRGPGADAGDPQPDPRGQDAPDLLGDPDLRRDSGMQTMDAQPRPARARWARSPARSPSSAPPCPRS